jgi:hypothetical protein
MISGGFIVSGRSVRPGPQRGACYGSVGQTTASACRTIATRGARAGSARASASIAARSCGRDGRARRTRGGGSTAHPGDLGERRERQLRQAALERPRAQRVDERRAEAPPGERRVDAHLLDVGAAVEDEREEIGDGTVCGVRGHPGASFRPEGLEMRERRGSSAATSGRPAAAYAAPAARSIRRSAGSRGRWGGGSRRRSCQRAAAARFPLDPAPTLERWSDAPLPWP